MLLTYPSKLLLFGEHTVLYGSEALAIPMWNFKGTWKDGVDSYDLYKLMYEYYKWLKENIKSIDSEALYKDYLNNYTIHTNIPIGYGAGSSGVICAAIFDRYYIGEPLDLVETKAFLGKMESYFHGKSSGLDPLVSYVKQGVHVKKDKSIECVQCTNINNHIFVVDTGESRSTSKYVSIFQEKYKNKKFKEHIDIELFPLVKQGIQSYLHNKLDDTIDIIKQISFFQYKYCCEFILEGDKYIWNEMLAKPDMALKLCGAGGGGFMIGIAKDKELATEIVERMKYPIHFLE
jgi:mevalonate kinase